MMPTAIVWEFISMASAPARVRLIHAEQEASLKTLIEDHIENGWSFSVRMIMAQTNEMEPVLTVDDNPKAHERVRELQRLADHGVREFKRTGRWRGPTCPLGTTEHWRQLEDPSRGACIGCGRIHSSLGQHGCVRAGATE